MYLMERTNQSLQRLKKGLGDFRYCNSMDATDKSSSGLRERTLFYMSDHGILNLMHAF